jgi:hypothetical protein
MVAAELGEGERWAVGVGVGGLLKRALDIPDGAHVLW